MPPFGFWYSEIESLLKRKPLMLWSIFVFFWALSGEPIDDVPVLFIVISTKNVIKNKHQFYDQESILRSQF